MEVVKKQEFVLFTVCVCVCVGWRGEGEGFEVWNIFDTSSSPLEFMSVGSFFDSITFEKVKALLISLHFYGSSQNFFSLFFFSFSKIHFSIAKISWKLFSSLSLEWVKPLKVCNILSRWCISSISTTVYIKNTVYMGAYSTKYNILNVMNLI